MDISQRLVLFYERLGALPPFESHDQALAEIWRVLTEIEDQFSGVLRDATDMPVLTDGRMYPPHRLYAKQCEIPGVTLYVQKGHWTYIGERGAVLIRNRKSGTVEFEKAGIDEGRIRL
jgi:hypothetical protein